MDFKTVFQRIQVAASPGVERLANDSQSALLTRRSDGALVIAVWNLSCLKKRKQRPSDKVQRKIESAQSMIYSLDSANGSLLLI
jgi:hypothetical protein